MNMELSDWKMHFFFPKYSTFVANLLNDLVLVINFYWPTLEFCRSVSYIFKEAHGSQFASSITPCMITAGHIIS